MEPSIRKRSSSPWRTRHAKRMILLDESKDDWRRTSTPSSSSSASDGSKASTNVDSVTEAMADFLSEYQEAYSPNDQDLSEVQDENHLSGAHANMHGPDMTESPAPPPSSSWRSESHDYTTESSDSEDEDVDHEDASTVADESNWEDENQDTPGSPGSDIELHDGVVRRGMYITVLLTNRERSSTLPCTAKVLDVHDRRGRVTIRFSKSARRAARNMWANSARSPAPGRGSLTSPRP